MGTGGYGDGASLPFSKTVDFSCRASHIFGDGVVNAGPNPVRFGLLNRIDLIRSEHGDGGLRRPHLERVGSCCSGRCVGRRTGFHPARQVYRFTPGVYKGFYRPHFATLSAQSCKSRRLDPNGFDDLGIRPGFTLT